MLKYAWQLLDLHFNECFEIVKDNDFYRGYALEKLRHSKQVVGAGNYIIPKINWLKNKASGYIDMVNSAVLLHDVCRFTEIVYRFHDNNNYDHGVGACELLKNTPMFNDIRIWLPIKHHGHIIEDLYNDEEFQNIRDEECRKEVELICFIIRDADKIANLNMFINEPDMTELFLGKGNGDIYKDGQISAIVKEQAFKETTTPRFKDASKADRAAGYLSWFMDINYKYSIDYCAKLNIIDNIFDTFEKICKDDIFREDYKNFVRRYLSSHEFLR